METPKGKTAVIDLGVMGAPSKGLNLEKGDKVIAIGRSARINGKPVLFAKWAGELYSVGNLGKPAKMGQLR